MLIHHLLSTILYTGAFSIGMAVIASQKKVTTKTKKTRQSKEEERKDDVWYRTLFDFSPSGLMLQDAFGTIVNVNEALATIVGYSREELLGKNVEILVANRDKEVIQVHREQILSGQVLEHQVTNVSKTGEIVTIELREKKITLPNGDDGILVVAINVTERLKNDQERKSQYEQLQAIYHLTDSVHRATELEVIYEEALTALTKAVHVTRASILLFEPDGVLRFKAWRGISDLYRSNVEGHTPWTQDTVDPAPIFVPDVMLDPAYIPLLPFFEQEHIRSVGFIPLICKHKLLGKFMVYYSDPHSFSEDEEQMLLTIAGHIAFVIERRRSEFLVAKSEEQYRTLAEAAHDAIFIIDKNDTIEYVNSFAATMFRKLPEEIIGKPRKEFFTEDVAERQGQALHKIFRTGIPAQLENSFLVGNVLYWHDTFLAPIRNEQGTIVSVLGISRNITERKKTEEALRMSAEQQGLVLRSLPMVFYTTRPDGDMATTWISEQIKELTGYAPEHFTTDSTFWISRIHEEDRQRALREYESVLSEGSIRSIYRWKCADDTYRWFSDQTVLIRDANGVPTEIIGIWLDVTNQKIAEESVKESEARWRTLTENSPGLVHMIDRDGTIQYINRATIGYERNNVIGSTIYEYVSPETAIYMREQTAVVFDENRAVWFEVQAAGPYGTEAWYTVSMGPIVHEGVVVSAIMYSVDITEHKRREHLQNAVYRIAQLADQAKSLDELFKAIHGIIQEAMKVNNFYIALYDEKENLLSFPYFVDEIDSLPEPVEPDRGLTSYVLRTGRSLLANIEGFDQLVEQGEAELVGAPSPIWLGVPLKIDDKTIGVMVAQDYHDEHAYSQQELHMLEYISSQIAMAIKGKQAEDELRESEERYRSIFEESKDCIYVTTADGRFVDINPAGVHLFGYTTRDEFFIDDERHRFWNSVLRNEEARLLRRQGYVQDFELTLERKDGTRLIVLDTATTVRDEHGSVIGYRGVMRDITARKKAEAALRESEIKLREIVEHSTNLFYSHTTDHILTYVSPQTSSYFDCEPEEALIEWTKFATDHPINHIGFELTQKAINTGIRQQPFRLELIGKKERKIWVEVNESPVVIDGKTIAIVGSLTDITVRVKAEDEINKLRKAVNTSGEVIFITDQSGIIQFINPEFTRLYGYAEDEVVGKATPRILKSGVMKKEDYEFIWSALESKQFVKKEFVNQSKTGKRIIVEASISPIMDERGNIDGFLAIQLDITERKKLEEQFLRTQRLESLGTLAGGVAHDLNNVLAPILLSIEVMKRYAINDHAKKVLHTIEISAERGKQIIKQILSFARGTEGERGTIQLRHVIKEMEQIARETFPRAIEVHTHIQKELWTVSGDPTQLHQVLLNLCVNARDAMSDGGSLELRAENIIVDEHFAKMQYDAKAGPYILISVADTGSGIPADVLPKIFDPFFTTKAQGAGTGLGLSTVHAIVKGHQGFIDVYSHIGKGSTFKVYIPAKDSSNVILQTTPTAEYPTGNGELILVVDDEASIRDITRFTLEMYHYTVLTASDGAKAFELYTERQSEIALVITDMMMPVMDGAALIRALREINPTVKIVASSGISPRLHTTGLNEYGADGFLPKPYTAERLLTTIFNVLSKQ